MINEHEYFSAFSRENRIFQRLEASNMLFGTQTQALHTSRSASPSPPAQGKGCLCIHGRTFGCPPLSSPQPLFPFPELRHWCATPGAGHGWPGLPQVPSSPSQPSGSWGALPGLATLRSKRPALRINTVLVTSQSPGTSL